ncbi:MAG: TadE family protein [Pseudomonadota bacterium]
MASLTTHIQRFARDEGATASMEFVIMFPVAILLFVAVAETGMILTRQVLLERSLHEAVRVLRLANDLAVTSDQMETAICEETQAIPDCDNVLVVDVTVVQPEYFVPPSPVIECVDRTNFELELSNDYDTGTDNEMVVIRACAAIDRLVPFSGFGLNLSRDEDGAMYLVSSTVMINEPD